MIGLEMSRKIKLNGQKRLADRVMVVTGASRGLGRACAIGLANEGAHVVVAARSSGPGEESINRTTELIGQSGGSAMAVKCDVSSPDSLATMADIVVQRFGRIDALINNAAYFAKGSLVDMTEEDWLRQIDVNLNGVFRSIRAVLPAMMSQRSGHIINVSSIAATKGSHYGVTKRGVQGLTMGFSQELESHGIAVNALRPVAAIRTPGWERSRPPEVLAKRAHRVSPPDSYVEAAILIAMLNAGELTGAELSDAEVLRKFGTDEANDRFREMNAPVWNEAFLEAVSE